MIIIGAGNLGQALANYVKFEKNGFLVKGLFDVNPKLKGVAVRGILIRMTDELPAFLQEHDIQIAALTLPKQYAKEWQTFWWITASVQSGILPIRIFICRKM